MALFLCVGISHADVKRWTGAGADRRWSLGANWEGGIVPAPGDQLVFPSSPRNDSENDLSSGPFESIRIETNHYVVTGLPLVFTGAAPVSGMSGDIAVPVRLTHPDPIIEAFGGGMMTLAAYPGTGNTLEFTGNLQLQVNGQLQLIGNLIGTSPSSITANGRGSLYLRGNNAISGFVSLNGVAVKLSTGFELGSAALGTVLVDNSGIDVNTYSEPGEVAIYEPFDFGGFNRLPTVFAEISTSGSWPVSFRGPFALNGGPKRIWTDTNTIFQGPLSGNAEMWLYGSAPVSLMNPANTFSGAITLFQGSSLRNGASDVIPDGVDLAVVYTAKYDLGPYRETIRSFACDGRFGLKLGEGQLRVKQSSRVFNCTLEFTADPGLVPASGDVITIIANDSGAAFVGTFKDLPEGGIATVNGVRMRATYLAGTGRDFALVGIAPPAPAVALAIVSGDTQSLTRGASSYTPFVVRALDSAGRPAAGATVTFLVENDCGAFAGLPIQQVTTDIAGNASSQYFSAKNSTTLCLIRALLPGSPPLQTLRVYVFDPSELSLVATPASVTARTGQVFSFVVRAMAAGMTLPGVYVEFAARSTDRASATSIPPSGTTLNTGDPSVLVSGVANSYPGQYEIEVRSYGATLRVPANQVANFPARSFTTFVPWGSPITASITSGDTACSFVEGSSADYHLLYPQPPSDLVLLWGVMAFKTMNCPAGAEVAFTIEAPSSLASTARFWIFGRTADDLQPHWYSIPITINGNRGSFVIRDGGSGDDDRIVNGSIVTLGGIGWTTASVVSYQDLWWSGAAENGWGMSIIQHGDMLFANAYIYDDQGQPTWLVVPGGAWNAAHTSFSGNLYIPRGSPFFAYDVSKFNIGIPVGTATFTFADSNTGVFDYTINGVAGRKSISRLSFGRPDTAPAPSLGDLWWGGESQNGWGITVLQQMRTLFSLWFTYDAGGAPTWYVMPGGEWTSADTYEGRLYRAVGPPWIGRPYDASQHRTIDVGSFRLRFAAGSATLDYSIEGRSGTVPLTRLAF